MNFNKPVYKIDDVTYVCDYIFIEYWFNHLDFKKIKQGTDFMGAVGSVKEGKHNKDIGGGRCFDFNEMIKLYKEKPEGFIIFDKNLFEAILSIEKPQEEVIREIISFSTIEKAYAKDDKEKSNINIIRHAKGLLKALENK